MTSSLPLELIVNVLNDAGVWIADGTVTCGAHVCREWRDCLVNNDCSLMAYEICKQLAGLPRPRQWPLRWAFDHGTMKQFEFVLKFTSLYRTESDVGVASVFYAAVRLGKIDHVRLMLKDPFARSSFGYSYAIGIAIKHDQTDVVRMLLDPTIAGADLCAKGHQSPYWKILELAAKFERVEVLRLLLENGFNVNTSINTLGWAAINNSTEMVRLLLKYGERASVDAIQKAFCNYANTDILRMLLEDAKANGVSGSLHIIYNVSQEVESLMFEEYDIITPTYEQYDLTMCAKRGRTLLTKIILDRSRLGLGPVLRADAEDSIALVCAAAHGHFDIVTMLLEAGARDDDSMAFKCAAAHGHTNIVRVLLEYKPSKQAVKTALQDATTHCHIDVVCLLLEELRTRRQKWTKTAAKAVTAVTAFTAFTAFTAATTIRVIRAIRK